MPTQVETVELQRRVLGGREVYPPDLIQRPEPEQRRLTTGERMVRAQLVIAIAERVLGVEQREQRPRVRIARRDRDRAAAVVKRRRRNSPRVVERDVGRGVGAIGGRRRGARRHDSGDEAAVAGGVAARVEVDAADQIGMDDRRAERDVKQRGHTHAVEVETRVAGVGAANDVDGGRPHDLRNTGERADHTQRVTRRARDRARFVAGDVDVRDLGTAAPHRGLVALAGLARRQPEQLGRRGYAVHDLDPPVGRVVSGELDLEVMRSGADLEIEAPGVVRLPRRCAVESDHGGRQRPSRTLFEHQPGKPQLRDDPGLGDRGVQGCVVSRVVRLRHACVGALRPGVSCGFCRPARVGVLGSRVRRRPCGRRLRQQRDHHGDAPDDHPATERRSVEWSRSTGRPEATGSGRAPGRRSGSGGRQLQPGTSWCCSLEYPPT